MSFHAILKELLTISTSSDQRHIKACELLLKTRNTYGDKAAVLLTEFLDKIGQKDINFTLYEKLLPLTKLAFIFEKNGLPEEHALKLSTLFDSLPSVLTYLADAQTVHNACLFNLPTKIPPHFSIWKNFARKYLTREDTNALFTPLLANANEIETMIEDANKTSTSKPNFDLISAKKAELRKLKAQWKKLKKHHGTLTPQQEKEFQTLSSQKIALNNELVALCAGIHLEQADLEILTAFFEKYMNESNEILTYFLSKGLTKNDYAEFIQLQPCNDDQQIPPIAIDAIDLGYSGFYLKKIDVLNKADAARAAVLGKLTDCCQSLSGEAGEACVIHGLTSPDGGFYVLCEGDLRHPKIEDKIVAQSWVWRGIKGGLVLDSIEIKPDCCEEEQSMIIDMYRYLGYQLVANPAYKIGKVTCGNRSGISAEVGLWPIEHAEIIANYSGYRDSDHQLMIAEKNKPYLLLDKFKSISFQQKIQNEVVSFVKKLFSSPIPHKEVELSDMIRYALTNNDDDIISLLKENSGKRHDELMEMIQFWKLFSKGWQKIDLKELIPLLAKGFDINLLSPYDKLTPLMIAVKQNDEISVKKLLAMGADVSRVNLWDESALQHAANGASVEIVGALLAHGADVSFGGFRHFTPIHCALANNNRKVLPLLTKYWVEKLCQENKVNQKDASGHLPLAIAASYGDEKIVAKLLENGAKVSLTDFDGETALHKVGKRQNAGPILTLLLEHATASDMNTHGILPNGMTPPM